MMALWPTHWDFHHLHEVFNLYSLLHTQSPVFHPCLRNLKMWPSQPKRYIGNAKLMVLVNIVSLVLGFEHCNLCHASPYWFTSCMFLSKAHIRVLAHVLQTCTILSLIKTVGHKTLRILQQSFYYFAALFCVSCTEQTFDYISIELCIDMECFASFLPYNNKLVHNSQKS